MISFLVDFVSKTLVPFGFWGVFAGSVLEEFIAIIPSAIVSMGAGYFFLTGLSGIDFIMSLIFYVILPVTLGIVIGSLPVYYIAYFLGEPFVMKWGKWFGLKKSDLDKIQSMYKKSRIDEYLVFLGRIIPFLPSVAVSAFAGLTKIPLKVFILGTVLGTPIRATFFGILGWQVGAFYERNAQVFDTYDTYALVGIICAFAIFVFYRKMKEIKKKEVIK